MKRYRLVIAVSFVYLFKNNTNVLETVNFGFAQSIYVWPSSVTDKP